MKTVLKWAGRVILAIFTLTMLFIGVTRQFPGNLINLAVGFGILFWLAIRFQRYRRDKSLYGPADGVDLPSSTPKDASC